MTVKEARKIVQDFNENKRITDEDEFMFIETMNFLIEEEKDPRDMMWLGGYYYELKRFDLALKYYEMAAAMENEVETAPAPRKRHGWIWIIIILLILAAAAAAWWKWDFIYPKVMSLLGK